MAPATITETELEHPLHTNEWIETKLTHLAKESSKHGTTGKGFTIDTYDKMLRPETSFLKPLRRLEKRMGFMTPLRWVNIILIVSWHVATILYTAYYFQIMKKPYPWGLTIYGWFIGVLAGFGVTAGVHRLWCHRSYKATLPLQLFLLLCYSVAGQITIYEWVRDHRVHHKFSETTADPHNANRGFFYAHVGWLMMKKHPDVAEQGSKVDLSDITDDPLIQFYDKYFTFFKLAFCFVIPTLIPVFLWDQCWDVAIVSQCGIRFLISLHSTWSVNSFAHLWGNKPYDKNIMPVENWGVSILSMGEGWHNYHHTFPWDYKAAELGIPISLTTKLLNFFAKIGWAYDLKEASPALVESVINARGDPQRQHRH